MDDNSGQDCWAPEASLQARLIETQYLEYFRIGCRIHGRDLEQVGRQ